MPDRIILINKPYTWTSFDVVKKLKRPLLEERRMEFPIAEQHQIKKLKVGHAGTLDPLATGLLVICTGKNTKRISEIQDAEKEYTGTMVIGSVTESYDLEKPPINFKPIDGIEHQTIFETAITFLGKQVQFPPLHSAKKIDGQRAYKKARRGDDFELKGHVVNIKAFDIMDIRLPEIDFRVVCTKGTYIRSLANDFGIRIGTGAHLSSLCRTRIGNYSLKDALSIDEFISQISDNQTISL
jgi:tRNA pseudouridine55 synthase